MSSIEEPGLPEQLDNVFGKFDSIAKECGFSYDIVSDEAYEQGYKVKPDDYGEFGDHLRNEMESILGDDIIMRITRAKDGVVLSFTIATINDGDISEDQHKYPSYKHIERQSTFPSSYGDTRTFGGITKKHYGGSGRKKRKKKRLDESKGLVEVNETLRELISAIERQDRDDVDTLRCTLGAVADQQVDQRIKDIVENIIYSSKYLDLNDVVSYYHSFLRLWNPGKLESIMSDARQRVIDRMLSSLPEDQRKMLQEQEDRTEPSGIETPEAEQIVQFLILIDNYARLVSGLNIPYEPHYDSPEEAWSAVIGYAEGIRTSALSVNSREFIESFYTALSEWSGEDRFEQPNWQINPNSLLQTYRVAMQYVNKERADERILAILSDPWEYRDKPMLEAIGRKPGDSLDPAITKFADRDIVNVVERFQMSPAEWDEKFKTTPSTGTISSLSNNIDRLMSFESSISGIISEYQKGGDVASSIAAYETLMVIASRLSKLNPSEIFDYLRDQLITKHKESLRSIIDTLNAKIDTLNTEKNKGDEKTKEPEMPGRTITDED